MCPADTQLTERQMSEKEFVTGMFAKAPHPNAPEFVKASISITRADLGNWLRGRPEQYINIDIKESQNGKWYAEVNNFVPEKVSNPLNPQY